MKTILFFAGIFALTTNVLFAQTPASADIKNSIINWTGHAEVGSYSPAGTLNFKEGHVSMKDGNITAADFTVDMTSMKQDNETLLGHLKSDDFFDVAKYPTSRIVISKIANGRGYGLLTIKNKTLPFNCGVIIAKSNGKTIITGNATIDRTQYGIIYNSGNFFSGLGDKAIKNTFDINFSIVILGGVD